MKRILILSPFLLSACAATAPAPVVQGKIQPNYTTTPQVTKAQETLANPSTVPAAVAQNPALAQALVTEESYSAAPLLREEQLVTVQPAAGPATPPKPLTGQSTLIVDSAPATTTHTVQANDTLYKIARTYKTTPEAIRSANNLRDIADLTPGRTLTIPANTSTTPSLLSSINTYLQTPPTKGQAVTPVAVQPVAKVVPVTKPAQYEMVKIEPAAGPKKEIPQSSTAQHTHVVKAGETIYRISKQYNVSVLDIMAANDLDKPEALQAGIKLKIPTAIASEKITEKTVEKSVTKTIEKQTIAQSNLRPAADLGVTETTRATIAAQAAAADVPSGTRPLNDPDKGTDNADTLRPLKPAAPIAEKDKLRAELKRGAIDKVAASTSGLAWPARGNIIKRFGEKGNGVAHTGINIAVPLNTPVLATENGTVLYANEGLRTYGKMVLLQHPNGMVSAYAHNGYLLVRKGEKVKKGQVIATSGQSGNVESPQVHFELRRAAKAIDPLTVLPN